MKKILQICKNCQQEYLAPLPEVKRGRHVFCSRRCAAVFNWKSRHPESGNPNVVCAYCQRKFYRNISKQAGSKSGLYFCCREHKDLAQRIGGIKEIQPPHYGDSLSAGEYRVLAFRNFEHKCVRCNYAENEKALIVHHKNRDRTDVSLPNLEILCANCHAIEHW